MTGGFDDMMEGMAEQAAREHRLAHKKVGFQELVVKNVLKHYKLSHEERQLRQFCYDQSGEHHLLFSWFMHLHPDFPVWLGARKHTLKTQELFYSRLKLPPVKATGLPPVTKTWMVRSLFNLSEEAPAHWDGPMGVVWRQYGHGRPLKVIHTADSPLVGWREQVKVETKHGTYVLTVEDLTTFLQGLRWSG